MFNYKLGLGPMSTEIIESVYAYSHRTGIPLMLIASMNQINYKRGYVNGWTTRQYTEHLNTLQKKYPKARILKCRDHCGPGIANQDLDPYACIRNDIDCGFDLIHLDWSRTDHNLLKQTRDTMEFCKQLNPDIMLEIGTDVIGMPLPSVNTLSDQLDYLCRDITPEFYVVNTGSQVKDYSQVGTFCSDQVSKLSALLHSRGIKLKEHNADYLTVAEIKLRHGIVDAVNIAPQLGYIQTAASLTYCENDLDYNLRRAYWYKVLDSGYYRHWELNEHEDLDRVLMSGHYCFNTDEYKNLQIDKNYLKKNLRKTIDAYIKNI